MDPAKRSTARQPLAARWQLHPAEAGAAAPSRSERGWLPIPGPMTAAAALRELGQWSLDGPPRDFDAQDWWYAAHFDARAMDDAVLGFDGLATSAEVWLNGTPLLNSSNMFVAHQVRAGTALRERGNELLFRFAALQPELARRRPRPRWRTPMVANQQLRWWRTTLLGRTPGWSPPCAPVGPWRDLWLSDEATASHRLVATVEGDDGVLALDFAAGEPWVRQAESAELVLRGHGIELRKPLTGSAGQYQARIVVPQVRRWWPHTHGEPELYEASLRVQARSGATRFLPLGRVGFRRIEVDTADGGFTLRVNGERVFCRGAGWTPLDPVSLRSTPEACLTAVAQARDGGMNMLRLAGTLVYEEDHFYEACDELGVLVWQDFMFASMDYPFDDAAFAADAAHEARQQLQRLRRHPCVAVLCGNSEVEQQAAMWGAPRELWQPGFFHQALPALCAAEAPGIPYWPSSAHGGAFPHQADCGTTSYYGVGAYERPLDDARRSDLRFATECLAFANVPSPAALQRMPGGLATRVHHPDWKARSPRDLGAGWDFDDVRDHYVQRLLGADPARLRHADHDRYLALGRLATSEAMHAAFSEWRRPDSRCGGALLLFLRDLWAGAGWGVVDDAGAPKSAWHSLRRVLQPLAVLLTDEGGNGVAVHVLNETAQARGLQLEISAWRDGDVCVATGRKTLELPARSGRSLSCIDVLGQFIDLNHAYRFGPPSCEVVIATLLDRDGEIVARSFHFPLGLAGLLQQRARDIGLAATVTHLSDGEAMLAVQTRQLAIDVHFDIPGWQADDEHFHLAPGASAQVRLRRLDARAVLAGSLHALNLSTAVPVEASS